MKLFIKIFVPVTAIIVNVLSAQKGYAHDAAIEVKFLADSSAAMMPCTTPGIPTVTAGARCGSGTVVLSASPGSGGTGIQWENSGGTVLGTGTNFTTPSISSTTNYYAKSTVTSGGSTCLSTRVLVKATINTVPGDPAYVGSTMLCSPGNTTLDSEPGINANTTQWYAASSGGSPINATQFVSATTTFWTTSYNSVTGCEGASRFSSTITISPANVPTGITQGNFICGSGATSIWATPAGNANTLRWYTSSSGGSPFTTGTVYSTPTISSTTTYYISSYHTTLGCESARIAITATVSPIPGNPVPVDASRCGTGTLQLTGTPGANANLIAWYSSSDVLQEINIPFYTPSLSSSQQYKTKSYNSTTGCYSSTFVPVNATINTTTTIPTVTSGARCGNGTVVLTATPGSPATGIQWENSSGTVLGTGNSFTTPSLSSTTNFYAKSTLVSGGTCISSPVLAVATVNTVPAQPQYAGSLTICAAGNVTLDAEPGANANSIRWYTASTGGSPISATQFISATTTFWASSYNTVTGCESASRLSGTISIAPAGLPSGTAQDNFICGSGTAMIRATPGANSNTLRWYTASSGGSPVSTGTAYLTPTISTTTTYYISSYHSTSGCESGRIPITATVSPVPGNPVPVDAARCGTGTLLLTGTPGSNANLIAWYTSAGVLTEIDAFITTPSLSSSQQYKTKSYNSTTGCFSPTFITVNATINTKPGNPTLTNSSACAGPVTLTGTVGANGNAINWYTAASGGSPVSTNQTLSTTTTFYGASVVSATGCESDRVAKTVTINPLPVAAPTFAFVNYLCALPGTAQLMAYPPSGNSVNWYAADTGGSALTADDVNGLSFTTPSLAAATTYYITSRTVNGCESSPRTPVAVNLYTKPAAPTVTSAARCGTGSVTLTASSSGNTIIWKDSVSATVNTGSSYAPSLTKTATYTVVAQSPYCGSTPATVVATINPIPPATTDPEYVYSTFARGHGPVTLGSSFNSKWYDAPTNGTMLHEGATYKTNDLSNPQLFYHARYNATTQCESSRVAIEADIRPLISNGFVKTETFRVAAITQESQIATATDQEKVTVIEHYDGLLRTVQQTLVRGSVDGHDIVNPIEYDPMGRATKQYLPYIASTTDGSFRPDYKVSQLGFYAANNDKIANDTHPYAVSRYEHSPLGRPLEQGSVGAQFQLGTGHTSKMVYSFNTGSTNSDAEEVRKFNANGTSTGFYAVNTLHRTSSIDADGNNIIVFTDADGKTISKKQVVDTTATYLQTYYIYDDFGRVRYIVSPEGVNILRSNGWNLTPILKTYVYHFVYDSKGRVVEKRVPGQGRMSYGYDRWDRLVLVQDTLLRAQKKWMFLKYDLYGRIVMQGLYKNTADTTRTMVQQVLSGLYKISSANYSPSSRFETRGSILHGYANISFPKTNKDGSPLEVHTVNYFDTYDFDDADVVDDFAYVQQAISGEGTSLQGRAEGMATGTKTLVLNGGTTYLYTYIFYDRDGRVIQKRSNSNVNAAIENLATSVYDFEGKALASRKYNRDAPDVVYRYEYDNAGRAKAVYGPAPLSEAAQFTSGTNVAITGNNIAKNAGNNAWNAGAISTNNLATGENGWVEFKAGETATDKMIGLTSYNSTANYTDIIYTMYAASAGRIYIYENGTSLGQFGNYTVSDVMSIERRNGVIIYRKNFQILYTSLVASSGPLYVDCSIYAASGTFKDINLFRSAEVKMVQYDYNNLGQLVDKKLHNTSGNNFLQSVDYRYNIRGQLTSINNAPLTNDVSTNSINDETNDYFGLEMLYHSVDAGLNNKAYYNGNISALKWKGVGAAPLDTAMRSYQYIYDKANRLKSATSKMNSGSAWNKELNAFNEVMSYDHNGNIKTLQRNSRQHQLAGVTASYSSQQIDDLTYLYDASIGDRLTKVEDASGITQGFNNGANATTEFTYDGNGNVLSDANKGISAITYNHLGKPTLITFTSGKKIEYTYDAAGTKLRMRTLQGTTELSKTDYVEDFVYEGGVLKYFGSPEGRTVMNGGQREYQYAISDHQGNTRVVFTSAANTPTQPVATFEGDASDGSSQYTILGEVVASVAGNHTPAVGSNKVLRMNQTTPIGASKSIKVYPGDKVDMEVWSYYEGNSGWGSSSVGMSALITNVAAAFGGMSGGGGESGSIYSAVNTAYGAFGKAGNQGNAQPSAYLNYILYDKDYKYMNMGWIGVPASAYMSKQKISIDNINIKEPGYIFVYLSYEGESNNWVNFDDFKVTHTKTNVIQYNEYYPFGLQASTSWTRENNKNDFLYNAGSEINVTSGWYDLPFRNYDPVLGRFMQVDPFSVSEEATYQYAGNNPVLFNDPMGLSIQRPDWNKGFHLSNQLVDSGIKGVSDGSGLGGGYIDWNQSSSNIGPSAEDIQLRNELQKLGADAHLNAKGQVEIWEEYGGEQISREEWIRLGGHRDKTATMYFSGQWTPVEGNGQTNAQQGPTTTFEVRRSWLDSGQWDWFVETVTIPIPGGYTVIQNGVIVTYDETGNFIDVHGGQRTTRIINQGTQEQWDNPTVTYQSLQISPLMNEYIMGSINFYCGNCLTTPTVDQKYWGYNLAPGNSKKWYESRPASNNNATSTGKRR